MAQSLDDKDSKSIAHVEGAEEQPQLLLSHYASLTRLQAIKLFKRRFIIGLLVNTGAIYLGFTLTLPGNIIANQGFINQFGTKHDAKGNLALNAVHVGAWAGINLGSQVLTQLISPFIAQRFGLKFNLYTLTVLIIVAVVLEIVAKEWIAFLMAKLVCGLAAGFIGTSVTAYMSEITTTQFRGIHLTCFSFAFGFGGLLGTIALEILQQTTPLKYRNAFYSEFAIVGIWLPVLVFLPESPVWYCKKGMHDKAKAALHRLTGNVEGYDEEYEYAVFRQDVEESEAVAAKSSSVSWLACFRGTNLRRTLISTIPFSLQNWVGGPLIGSAAFVFQALGMDNPFQASVIISVVMLFGTLCSFYLIDKVGRRPLLIWGGLALCACDMVLGGLGVIGISKATGSGMIAIMAIWAMAYSLSYGPIGWMALVENSTPVLRTQTAGIAAVLQSFSSVLSNYIVPLMISDQYAGWGIKTGFFFGPLAFLGVVLVWFVVPETKDRSYAELDELFERKIPAWRFKDTETAVQQMLENEAADTGPKLRRQASGV